MKFVPINVRPRTQGQSKVHFWNDGWRFLMVIVRIIMLYDPLRIFLPIAGGLTFLGFLAWALGIWHAGRVLIPNATMLMFVVALLTVLIGLLASQLANSRIHYFGDETVTVYDSEKSAEGEESVKSVEGGKLE